METSTIIGILIQIALLVAVVLFSRRQGRGAGSEPAAVKPAKSGAELSKLIALREKHLNTPLSETARPKAFAEIVGQAEGVRALKAALCGPNPQHVLIYGPPGVGKTCAARLVLEEAKARPDSPFTEESAFIEMDATCIRFDERAIADPLIGSVHDPIYQGAGAMGSRGVPQPKPGAVTRAHCGVLFLDEIGELHPMQMNKLLKVLEDRRVQFESAYYSPENSGIPQHIHDIFQNGLPADFRLVGATTRAPEDLPPALRSRCVELHFRPLSQGDLLQISEGAAKRAGFAISPAAAAGCASHAHSGRDAVNMVQLAAGISYDEGRREITESDVLWVARNCHYAPCLQTRLPAESRVGAVAMLAVAGTGEGLALLLECGAKKSRTPKLVLGGMVESEELEGRGRRLRRKSQAVSSVENVLCAVSMQLGIELDEYELRFNIPGGLPADGPSAGLALAIALRSALTGEKPLPLLAATGEIAMSGAVCPVGGVLEKVRAAAEAGAARVLVPRENDEAALHELGAEVIPVGSLGEAFSASFRAKLEESSTFTPSFTDCTF